MVATSPLSHRFNESDQAPGSDRHYLGKQDYSFTELKGLGMRLSNKALILLPMVDISKHSQEPSSRHLDKGSSIFKGRMQISVKHQSDKPLSFSYSMFWLTPSLGCSDIQNLSFECCYAKWTWQHLGCEQSWNIIPRLQPSTLLQASYPAMETKM